MLSGFKGVQYGLQSSKARAKAGLPLSKPLAAFGEDSDDEKQTVGMDIERQAAKKRTDVKVERMHAAALAEDPSAFDYDGVYDSIQEQRVQPKLAEKHARKSRYIESLLDKAKEREREQDIVYERKLLRERKVEDHLFGDKEKFVTAAYRKKLEEDKKWLEEERRREEAEAADDVRKKGHLGDFYRNLLGNNVAFGTAKEPEKKEAGENEPPAQVTAAKEQDGAWEAARAAREALEARATSGEAASAQPDGAAAVSEAERLTGGMEGGAGEEAEKPEAPQKTEEEKRREREDKAAAAKERYLARKRKAPPE